MGGESYCNYIQELAADVCCTADVTDQPSTDLFASCPGDDTGDNGANGGAGSDESTSPGAMDTADNGANGGAGSDESASPGDMDTADKGANGGAGSDESASSGAMSYGYMFGPLAAALTIVL